MAFITKIALIFLGITMYCVSSFGANGSLYLISSIHSSDTNQNESFQYIQNKDTGEKIYLVGMVGSHIPRVDLNIRNQELHELSENRQMRLDLEGYIESKLKASFEKENELLKLPAQQFVFPLKNILIRGGKKYLVEPEMYPVEFVEYLNFPENSIEFYFAESTRHANSDLDSLEGAFGHVAVRIGNRIFDFYPHDTTKGSFHYSYTVPDFFLGERGYLYSKKVHGLRLIVSESQLKQARHHFESKLFAMKVSGKRSYRKYSRNCTFLIKELLKALNIKITKRLSKGGGRGHQEKDAIQNIPFYNYAVMDTYFSKLSSETNVKFDGRYIYPQLRLSETFKNSEYPGYLTHKKLRDEAAIIYPDLTGPVAYDKAAVVVASVLNTELDLNRGYLILGCHGPVASQLTFAEIWAAARFATNNPHLDEIKRLLNHIKNYRAYGSRFNESNREEIAKYFNISIDKVKGDYPLIDVNKQDYRSLKSSKAIAGSIGVNIPDHMLEGILLFNFNGGVRNCD